MAKRKRDFGRVVAAERKARQKRDAALTAEDKATIKWAHAWIKARNKRSHGPTSPIGGRPRYAPRPTR
jgi:hypothetical protein